MKFTFLSEAFYNEHIDHTEIEQKHDRPYVQYFEAELKGILSGK